VASAAGVANGVSSGEALFAGAIPPTGTSVQPANANAAPAIMKIVGPHGFIVDLLCAKGRNKTLNVTSSRYSLTPASSELFPWQEWCISRRSPLYLLVK
jgi:hypothetical protein